MTWRRLYVIGCSLIVVAVLLAWGRSYLPSCIDFRSHEGRLYVFISDGRLTFLDPDHVDYAGRLFMNWDLASYINNGWDHFGIEYFHGMWPNASTARGTMYRPFRFVSVPYWLLATIAAIPLFFAEFHRRRIRSRTRAGLCSACGYDVRFSSGRCPECGSKIQQRGPAAPAPDGMSSASG